MFRWFWKYLDRKINCNSLKMDTCKSNTIGHSSDELSNNPIQFRIHFADGGSILQREQYDQKTDRWNRSLFLINETDDMVKRISEIVSMEIIRG